MRPPTVCMVDCQKLEFFVFCFSVVLSVPGSRIPGESQWDNLRKIKGPLTIDSHYASWSLAVIIKLLIPPLIAAHLNFLFVSLSGPVAIGHHNWVQSSSILRLMSIKQNKNQHDLTYCMYVLYMYV